MSVAYAENDKVYPSYEARLRAECKARRARIAARAVHDDGIDLKRKPERKWIVPAEAPSIARITEYLIPKRKHKRKVRSAESIVELPSRPCPASDRLVPAAIDDDYRPRPSINRIQQLIGWRYNIPRAELLSRRRQRCIVGPRQVGMYLSKMLTIHSLPEIGRRFGGKDHTTILHATRKIARLRAAGDEFVTEAIAAMIAILVADGFDVSPLVLSQAGMDVEPLGAT